MSKAELPQPSTISRLVGIAGILLAHALALLFVMFIFVKIVPPYSMVFEDSELVLPVAVQKIVMWSEFWVAFWFLLFPFLMTLDAAIVLSLAFFAPGQRRILSAYSHCCLLAALTLVIYIAMMLTHAVYSMIR